MDLFEEESGPQEVGRPLAVRFRPQTLDEVLGQEHLVAPGRPFRVAVERDLLTSSVFYGPPGTGKTSLALVVSRYTRRHFVTLNAVLSGVKELKEVLEQAEARRRSSGRGTVLFVDEVHRWNKAQQDALLPWVEEGIVVLIGATTANPFFEVNQALLSRSRVYELHPLEPQHLRQLLQRVLTDPVRGYGQRQLRWEEGAEDLLVDAAQGDARQLLNHLEALVEAHAGEGPLTRAEAAAVLRRPNLRYDKRSDAHYDWASALIKSVRGSDPDAALYWMAAMLEAGEDPAFLWRRLLISACEDVGLADPQAIAQVEAASAAFDRVGLPEGRYFLSYAVLRLALAPKSNSTGALFTVLDHIRHHGVGEVPNHLRDSSRDAQALGHGKGYLYPHDFEGHWVPQTYLPEGLVRNTFYRPGSLGWEKGAGEAWQERRRRVVPETEEDP